MDSAYQRFLERVRELADIGHAEALLQWDQETYMPAKGVAARASSLGTLAGIRHQKLTDPDFVELVQQLKNEVLDPDGTVNLRELDREQSRAIKVPAALVVELTQTQTLAHEAWVEARQKADFTHFAPWLEKILALQLQVADNIGYEGSIYNAFLDEYEPGARCENIGPVFAELQQDLVPLVDRIAAKAAPERIFDQDFALEGQDAFGRQVMADMGFDLEAGRLDVAVHPFCSGLGQGDVRLTTRYSKQQLTQSIFGTIHEAGHGLYEQGLPAENAGQPLCQAISLGVHESQSRLWENMVGRSLAFWRHYLPKLKRHFPHQLEEVGLEQFYAAVNQVEPSLIRVEADEVTYNLHILLRFELERDLVEGKVEIADLPHRWNQGMEQYLGIRPDDDAVGVLQDVHWSFGLIGYFPTYALGNLYAAQLFECAQRAIPTLMEEIGRGQLAPLKDWLRREVHSHGRRLSADQLIETVTGEPLKAGYFVEYLQGKFGQIYGL